MEGGDRRLRFDVSDQPTPIVVELDVPPGTTHLTFRTHGPPPAAGAPFRLDDVWYVAPFTSAR